LIAYIITVPTFFAFFGWWLSANVSSELASSLIFWISFSLGITVAVASIESLFVIRNSTTSMFVTIDQLRSLRNKDQVNVAYGPGTHIAFPWETRLKENNISLEEAAQNFEFQVQCSDGLINGFGSFRLRPDLRSSVTFLNSVAGVASEIRDLIISEIVDQFSPEGGSISVRKAIDDFGKLNNHLQDTFAKQHHEVEDRYGIVLTDVTISKILPSEDVQKTLSGLTEATAIAAGTEILLGIPKGEMAKWIEEGKTTQADIKEARDRFMSISGNLEGMDISRNEYDLNIRGLDKEVTSELKEILKSPGMQAYLAQGGKKNNTRPRNRNRKPNQPKQG
jgi:regulator of protease activity HflC (stomatin/prohibitin superfamily)